MSEGLEPHVQRRMDDLAARLQQIGEELDDLSFEVLRGAARARTGERPAIDKVLVQARRAVSKAAVLLAGDGPASED